MYVLRNTRAHSRNHFCRGKAVNITYSECVFVALVIQHAKRMRRIILYLPIRLNHVLSHHTK
jgi:hypothetical protein